MLKSEANKKLPVPAIVATDIVLFTVQDNIAQVRLIPVNRPPHYKNKNGLPGGLIYSNETAEQSIVRNIIEKTGITRLDYYEQLATMSAIKRDPRSRVVSVAYMGIISSEHSASMVDDERSSWQPLHTAKGLAFDHDQIVHIGLERLRSKLSYTNIIAFFLPMEFTLTELQEMYEVLTKKRVDKRNFRKKILATGMLKEVKGKTKTGKHRPAAYYKFTKRTLQYIEAF